MISAFEAPAPTTTLTGDVLGPVTVTVSFPKWSSIFGIACALGAAAGVLIAPINYVQVQMGIGILIKAFAAAVVGGAPSAGRGG